MMKTKRKKRKRSPSGSVPAVDGLLAPPRKRRTRRVNPTLDEIQMRMAAGVDPLFTQGKVGRVYHIRHIALIEYIPKDARKLGRPHFRIYGMTPGCRGDLMDTGLECVELQEALVTAIAFDSCKDPLIYADAALRVLGLRGGPPPQGT